MAAPLALPTCAAAWPRILFGSRTPIVKLTVEGDSITAGLGGTPTYPHVALTQLSGVANSGGNTPIQGFIRGVANLSINNIATSGISSLTIFNNYASRGGASFDATKNLNVFSIMSGTNTSGSNDTSANQKYLLSRSILRAARVTGYQRRLIGTITGRGDDPSYFTGTLLPLDGYYQSYFNSDLDCDGLFDFVSNPLFATVAAASNTTYYNTDLLHPTSAGQVVLGGIFNPALLAALKGPGTRTNAPATWSIFDYAAYLTLSNSNQTVAWTSSGFSDASIRGFNGKTSGKWYWETSIDLAAYVEVGIVNENFDATQQVANLQNTVNAVGYGGNGWGTAAIQCNSVTLASMAAAPANGNIIRHALDLNNNLYWMAIGSGNWNANSAYGPGGAGGASISTLVANGSGGKIYPAGYIRAQGGQITSRFASAEQSFAAPAGFTSINP